MPASHEYRPAWGNAGRGSDAPSWYLGRRRALVLLLLFVALFVVLLAITFPDGRETLFWRVPADATANEAIPRLGSSDARRYVEIGRDLGVDHAVPVQRRPVLNLWPPGVPFFYAVLFAIFGPQMPLGLVIGVALAALWAGALTLFADLLLRYLPVWAVALAIGAVLLSDVTQEWFFGLGLFWSEGLYTWTMLMALYASVRAAVAATSRSSLGWATGVGVALGASAYVRTTSELMARVLTALVIAWAVLALAHRGFRHVRSRRGGELAPLHSWNEKLLALALCMVAFHAVTLPWRVIAAQRLRPDNYAWSTATNQYWFLQWMPDRLLERDGQFLITGEANTACKIDSKRCRQIAKVEVPHPFSYSGHGNYSMAEFRRFTIDTIEAHPAEWMRRRLALLPGTWFGSRGRSADDPRHEIVQNGLLLAGLAAVAALSIARTRRSGPDLLVLLAPTLLAASIAPALILPYEVRSFFPVKILLILTLAALIAVELRDRRADASGGLEHTAPELPRVAVAEGEVGR